MRITSAIHAAQAMARIANLSPDDVFNAMMNTRCVLVDIREREELDSVGTIPGSIHIPRGMLEFCADPGNPSYRSELTPDASIILICSTGHRSALSTERLTSLGFIQVAHLRGGIEAWIQQGLPIHHPTSSRR